MAVDARTSELLLRYIVDQGSVQQALAANDQIKQSMQSLQQQAAANPIVGGGVTATGQPFDYAAQIDKLTAAEQRYSQAAQQAGQQSAQAQIATQSALQQTTIQANAVTGAITQGWVAVQNLQQGILDFDALPPPPIIGYMDQLHNGIGVAIHDIGDLGNDIQAIPEPPMSAFGLSEDAGGGGGISSQDIRGARYALMSIPGAGQLTGPLMGASYLGPLAIGISAVGLAAYGVIENANNAAQALDKISDAAYKINTQAQGYTQQQIQANVTSAQQGLTGAQQNQSAAQAALNAYLQANPLANTAYQQWQGQAGSPSALGGAFDVMVSGAARLDPQLVHLADEVTNTGQAVTTAQQALDSWTGKIDTQTAAANTASAALVANTQTEIQAEAMTSDQRQAKIAEIQGEITAYQNLLATGGLVQTDIDAVNGKISDLSGQLTVYQGIVSSTADAQAQLNELTQQQVTDAQNSINANTMSAQQRDQQIDQNIATEGTLRDLIASGTLTGDALTQVQNQFNQLFYQTRTLEGATHTYGDALQAESDLKDALKQQSDANTQALKTEADAEQKVEDATTKVAQARADLAQTTTDDQAKVTQIQADAQTTRLDDQTKYNQKIAQLDSDFQLHELQQQQKDNLTIEQQVAAGNLAAAEQTIQNQNLQRQQDKQNLDVQKTQAKQAYDDQLTALQQQEDKQLASEKASYTAAYSAKQQALSAALQQQQQADAALASAQAEAAFTQQYWAGKVADAYTTLGQYASLLSNQLSAQSLLIPGLTGDYNQLTTAMQANRAAVQAQISGQTGGGGGGGQYGGGAGGGGTSAVLGNLLAGLGGLGSGSSYGQIAGISATAAGYNYASGKLPASFTGTPFPSFDSGGINTSPGLFFSGIPEAHIPLSQMGNNSLTFNVSDPSVVDKIVTAVKPVIEQSGQRWAVSVVQGLTDQHQRTQAGSVR